MRCVCVCVQCAISLRCRVAALGIPVQFTEASGGVSPLLARLCDCLQVVVQIGAAL